MIQETTTFTCRSCGSPNIIKNRSNKCGNPQYHCKDCRAYRVLKPRAKGHEMHLRQRVLKASQERVSLRGIQRIFGVCRQTTLRWIRQHVRQLPMLADTILPFHWGDVLEVDELWSFVAKKNQNRWIWLAQCRRTHQILTFYIGNRDEAACQQLWQRFPKAYFACPICTDEYAPYANVFPTIQHRPSPKGSSKTSHIECWNNTLRQRLSRFVRKSLSFSKSDQMHYLMVL
ncbi:MAG: IS1 family transposase [Anaerolineaceae bacterium]|nr:IS1 family transposase [Anaerolineaceae bacterium]